MSEASQHIYFLLISIMLNEDLEHNKIAVAKNKYTYMRKVRSDRV